MHPDRIEHLKRIAAAIDHNQRQPPVDLVKDVLVYQNPKPRRKTRPWTVVIPTSIGFDHKTFRTEEHAKAYVSEHYPPS